MSGAIFTLSALPGTTVSYTAYQLPIGEVAYRTTETTPTIALTTEETTSADTSTQKDTEAEEKNSPPDKGAITDERGAPRHVSSTVTSVPFFSQFDDISSPQWKKVGCGIASLAMLIEYHNPGALTSVDTLLQEGIDADAYLHNAGWTYAGLIGVSKKYGLDGTTHDLGGSSVDVAFEAFRKALTKGPVMASVHYTFVPTNPIPHLVIVTDIRGDTLYYNDPAEKSGGGSISLTQFKSAWKKRYIEFYKAS